MLVKHRADDDDDDDDDDVEEDVFAKAEPLLSLYTLLSSQHANTSPLPPPIPAPAAPDTDPIPDEELA